MPENETPTVALGAKQENVTLSQADLQLLIASAVEAAVKASKNSSDPEFIQALKEINKPYIDPRQEENEQQMRDQMKLQRAERIDNLKAYQKRCQHIQGSNPLSRLRSPLGLTSIIHHVLDTGEWIGICTNCNKIFRDDDPEYEFYMTKPSGNETSQSGQGRRFRDPRKAVEEGRKGNPISIG